MTEPLLYSLVSSTSSMAEPLLYSLVSSTSSMAEPLLYSLVSSTSSIAEPLLYSLVSSTNKIYILYCVYVVPFLLCGLFWVAAMGSIVMSLVEIYQVYYVILSFKLA